MVGQVQIHTSDCQADLCIGLVWRTSKKSEHYVTFWTNCLYSCNITIYLSYLLEIIKTIRGLELLLSNVLLNKEFKDIFSDCIKILRLKIIIYIKLALKLKRNIRILLYNITLLAI